MKAFLILEDGTVFTGTSIGSTREIISEIVFNTSMTGYLEVLTDPSYAGQAVAMTYPLIGNYGICRKDMESKSSSTDGFIVRELSRLGSNFRSEQSIQEFLLEQNIPGIEGIDTRALTKRLREKGTMNGMITTNENQDLDTVIKRLKEYRVRGVVDRVTTKEILTCRPGDFDTDSSIPITKKVAILDVGTKFNIARCLLERGCEVTIYPAGTEAEDILSPEAGWDHDHKWSGRSERMYGDHREFERDLCVRNPCFCNLSWSPAHGAGKWSRHGKDEIRTPRGQSSGEGSGDRKGLYFIPEPWVCRESRYRSKRCGRGLVYQCK